jgi:hypothetical protein
MPIKFACPACKNVMTVDDKFAGKTGKCNKCGGPVSVPNAPAAGAAAGAASPPGAAASNAPAPVQTKAEAKAAQIAALNSAPPPSAGKLTASGPLGHVLDELTASDYARQSPYQNVYAPPKPKATNNEALKRAASTAGGMEDDKKPKIGSDGKARITSTLIVFGVLDVLEGLLLYGLVIAFAVVGISILDDVKDYIPFAGVGLSVLIIVFGLIATLITAAGLGLLTKQVWGHATAVFVYSFNLGLRIVLLLMSITEPKRMMGPAFLTLCMLSCTSYFFQAECKAVFGIKSNKVPLIIAAVGVTIPLLLGGLLFLLGALAPASSD